jgi:hypothetical protein
MRRAVASDTNSDVGDTAFARLGTAIVDDDLG